MAIRERKQIKKIKLRDDSLDIPRTLKQAGRHIRDAASEIQERSEAEEIRDTPSQFATEKLQRTAQLSAEKALQGGKSVVRLSVRAARKLWKHLPEHKKPEGNRINDPGSASPGNESVSSDARHGWRGGPGTASNRPRQQGMKHQQSRGKNIAPAHFAQQQDKIQQLSNPLDSPIESQSESQSLTGVSRDQGRARLRRETYRQFVRERLIPKSGQGYPEIRTRASETIHDSPISKSANGRSFSFAQSRGKKIASGASGTKDVRRNIKAASLSIKTAQQTTRVAQKSAQATQKTAALAKRAFVKAAKTAEVAAKSAAKAVVAAVKALVAAAKALVAAIAAGGWAMLVVVLIIGLIATIIASPVGIFFSGDSGGITISEAIAQTRTAYRAQIEQIRAENPANKVILDYEGEDIITNWRDIVAIFAVATTTDIENGMDVVTLDDARMARFMDIAFQMNPITWAIAEVSEEIEVDNDDGTTALQTQTGSVLTITVNSLSFDEMAFPLASQKNSKRPWS